MRRMVAENYGFRLAGRGGSPGQATSVALVGRRDVIVHAYREHQAGRITLAELLSTVRQWRPAVTEVDQVVLDDEGAGP